MKHLTPVLGIFVFAPLLCLYVGSYFALVETGNTASIAESSSKVTINHAAVYSRGGHVAEIAFWPAHQVDRRVRPDVWVIELSPTHSTSCHP